MVAGGHAHWVSLALSPLPRLSGLGQAQSLTRPPLANYLQSPVVEVRFATTPSPQKLSPLLGRTSLFTSLSPEQTETPCDNTHLPLPPGDMGTTAYS